MVHVDREGNVVWHALTVLDERDHLGFQGYSFEGNLVWIVPGSDPSRAAKAVSEKVGMIIEAGVWGDPERTRALFKKEGG